MCVMKSHLSGNLSVVLTHSRWSFSLSPDLFPYSICYAIQTDILEASVARIGHFNA